MMSIFQKLISASAFAALLIGAIPPVEAQGMPQKILGASGDHYTNPMFGDLHWTVGEVAVSQFQNEITLSEGFHQMYYELIVETYEVPSSEWLVRVFPNPTAGYVQADWASNGTVQAKLTTAAGKEVLMEQQMMKAQQIDLTGLPAGTYFLQLRNSKGEQGIFRILKVRK